MGDFYKMLFGKDYIQAKKSLKVISDKEKWVFKVNIIGTIILILLILISEFWASTTNLSPYLLPTTKNKNTNKQKIEMKQ